MLSTASPAARELSDDAFAGVFGARRGLQAHNDQRVDAGALADELELVRCGHLEGEAADAALARAVAALATLAGRAEAGALAAQLADMLAEPETRDGRYGKPPESLDRELGAFLDATGLRAPCRFILADGLGGTLHITETPREHWQGHRDARTLCGQRLSRLERRTAKLPEYADEPARRCAKCAKRAEGRSVQSHCPFQYEMRPLRPAFRYAQPVGMKARVAELAAGALARRDAPSSAAGLRALFSALWVQTALEPILGLLQGDKCTRLFEPAEYDYGDSALARMAGAEEARVAELSDRLSANGKHPGRSLIDLVTVADLVTLLACYRADPTALNGAGRGLLHDLAKRV